MHRQRDYCLTFPSIRIYKRNEEKSTRLKLYHSVHQKYLCIDWGHENITTSLKLVSKVIYCLVALKMCCFNHKGWCLTRSHEHFPSVYLLGLLSDLQTDFSTSSAGIFSLPELLCAGDDRSKHWHELSAHLASVLWDIPWFVWIRIIWCDVLCFEKQCKSRYNVRNE